MGIRRVKLRKPKRRKLAFESLETRRVLTSEWQNPDNPLDVNGNMWIGPSDALQVINSLQSEGSRNLAGTHTSGDSYYDVNGDGFVTPIDALLVINALRRGGSYAFVALTNDTAFAGGTATDRVTIDPSITGHLQNAKTRDRLFAGWDIGSDADLKDISFSRIGNSFSLTETQINDLMGGPLSPGEHVLTVVVRRDADQLHRLTFRFAIDVILS